jgi:hypothetical protein
MAYSWIFSFAMLTFRCFQIKTSLLVLQHPNTKKDVKQSNLSAGSIFTFVRLLPVEILSSRRYSDLAPGIQNTPLSGLDLNFSEKTARRVGFLFLLNYFDL